VVCLGSTYNFPECSDRWSGRVVFELPGIREISIGYQDMCARDAHGAVWCWGCNDTGAVGDGSTRGHATPLEVPL
jgi:alpha-tubulin suppressor-like RCC1 family protein